MVCSSYHAKSFVIKMLQACLLMALVLSRTSMVVADEKEPADSIKTVTNTSADLPAAVLWYQEKAKNGDPEAQYNLGNVYEMGFGVEVSYEIAAKWYKEAAEQDHQLAQLKLGLLYVLGKGVRESTLKGGKWIRSAARQGNSVAQTLQNKVLSHNVQQDFDVKALIEDVRLGLEKGETNAEETIKLALQKIERISKEAPKDSRLVKGVTGSGAKRGTVGNRVPSFLDKNPQHIAETEKSLGVIRRQAKEGIAGAQYKLARMYDKGEKVERDRKEALKWHIAAANQGYGPSQYRLGLAFLYGLGAEKNIGTARKWLTQASLANDSNAKLFLEHMSFANSSGTDKTIALSWYLERSLKGDGEAMLALGNMYENGWGVSQDTKEAKKWYVKARVAGTKGAAIQLRRIKADVTGGDEKPTKSDSEKPSTPSQPLAVEAAEQTPAINTQQQQISSPVESAPPKQFREKEKFIAKKFESTKDTHEDLGMMANVKRVFTKLVRSAKNARDAMFQKAKENATPLVLAFVGIIMGALVFRWMRKEDTDESTMF